MIALPGGFGLKVGLIGAAALALFAAGFAAGTCGKATNEQIDAAHDSTRMAISRADSTEGVRAELELRTRADSVLYAAVANTALREAAAANARRPTVVDHIVEREAPADTAVARRVAIAVTDSLDEHEIKPRDVAFQALKVQYAEQGQLLAATQAALETEQAAGQRRDVEIAALRNARPSWFTQHVIPALKLAGAAGAGYELGLHRRP